MALVARIRRLSLVLAAIGALVAPALAGERMAPGCPPGCPDEAQAKVRSLPPPDAGSAPTAAATRAPRTSVNPTDDIYVPKPKVVAPAPHAAEVSPAPATSRAPVPVPPARERKRESATAIGRAPQPGPQRIKVSIRNLPATPGMGTLLRVGATAGREISLLEFVPAATPCRTHSGRAPPLGPSLANPAPAALPGVPPSAAPLRACPPSRGTAPLYHPDPQLDLIAHRRAPRLAHAGADPMAALSTPSITERRPRARSGAGRPESAPPRDSSRLSGGLTT